jgi:hypothetical protein
MADPLYTGIVKLSLTFYLFSEFMNNVQQVKAENRWKMLKQIEDKNC